MFRRLLQLKNLIMSFFYDLRYYLIEDINIRVGAHNYAAYRQTKLYPDYMKVGNAAEYIMDKALLHCSGKGLDLGASIWPFPGARPIDFGEEHALNILEPDHSVDFIFSSHLFEHLDDPFKALDYWHSKIKPGGTLFLYLPHQVCKMWNTEYLASHKHNLSPRVMRPYFSERVDQWRLVEISAGPDAYQSFYVVAQAV